MVLSNWQALNPRSVQQWVISTGVYAPLVFVLLFTLAAVFFVPASVMVLAGGALFGPVMGSVYSLTGAAGGALAAFVISRYVAREWAVRQAGDRLRFMMDGVEREGWKFVFLVRVAGVPYFVLNYALGLTGIGVLPYITASILGFAPALVAMSYLGYAGFEVVSGGEGMLGKVITAIALMAMAALIPVVLRIVRRKAI